MKDIECPYCKYSQDINHDDGFGYSETEVHQMQCENCDKYFVFQTSIHYYYSPEKADCLNGSEHNYQLSHTFPKEYSTMRCADCDHERKLTEEEKKLILNH